MPLLILPITNALVANTSLVSRSIPITNGLSRVNYTTHLAFLLVGELNIARFPVLFQTLRLGCAGDGNHALGSNPGQRNLADAAVFTGSEFLDFVDNSSVLVEVLALKLRT